MPAATDVDVWHVSDIHKHLYQVTLKITDQLNGNGNYKLLLHVSQHRHYKLKFMKNEFCLLFTVSAAILLRRECLCCQTRARWILFYDLDLFVYSEFCRNWLVF